MARRRARGRGDDDVLGPPSSASRRRFQRWVARSAANFSRSEIARRATIFRRRSIYSSATDFSDGAKLCLLCLATNYVWRVQPWFQLFLGSFESPS